MDDGLALPGVAQIHLVAVGEDGGVAEFRAGFVLFAGHMVQPVQGGEGLALVLGDGEDQGAAGAPVAGDRVVAQHQQAVVQAAKVDAAVVVGNGGLLGQGPAAACVQGAAGIEDALAAAHEGVDDALRIQPEAGLDDAKEGEGTAVQGDLRAPGKMKAAIRGKVREAAPAVRPFRGGGSQQGSVRQGKGLVLDGADAALVARAELPGLAPGQAPLALLHIAAPAGNGGAALEVEQGAPVGAGVEHGVPTGLAVARGQQEGGAPALPAL